MNRQREISEMKKRQEDKMINHPYNYDTDTRSFRMVDNHIVNYGGSSMNETSYDSQSRVEHKVGRYGYVKLLDWIGRLIRSILNG